MNESTKVLSGSGGGGGGGDSNINDDDDIGGCSGSFIVAIINIYIYAPYSSMFERKIFVLSWACSFGK